MNDLGSGKWRWAHQDEIRREYRYRPFGAPGVEAELAGWLRARAWVSAESHPVLFTRAGEHLWPVGGANPSSRLRHPPVQPTVAGLVAALERLRELRALAAGLGRSQALPAARMRALTVDASTRRAGDLTKMSDTRRLATLVAFAAVAVERGQDDVLEHFDRLHGELQLRMRKQGERAPRDGEEIDRAGLTLAEVCRVLLEEPASEPISDAVFARVDRPRLLQAVTAIERLARSPEDRARELILTRCRNVRRYLPLLLDTIDFQATDAGMPILDALEALRQIPTGRGLSRQELPTEFIPPPWRRLTEPEPGRIDRPAYTMCVLEAPRWAAPPRRLRRLQRALRRPARQPARRARLERVPL